VNAEVCVAKKMCVFSKKTQLLCAKCEKRLMASTLNCSTQWRKLYLYSGWYLAVVFCNCCFAIHIMSWNATSVLWYETCIKKS